MAGLPLGAFDPSWTQSDTGQFSYNGVSSDPAAIAMNGGTGWFPSEQAAQNAWFAANPAYAQDAGQTNTSGPQLGSTVNGDTMAPAPTAAQLAGPQNPAIAGGYNPLQPSYLGAPPTLNATTAQGQTYNPTGYNAQGLSPQLMQSLGAGSTINSLVGANQPQFQQQDQQMMQMLATAGLAPSSTAGQTAFNNLAQQQLAGMDPSIASAIQNSQSNQLNAGQFNAGVGNAAGQFNAGAANTAGQYNAGNLQQAGQFNANAQNTASGQNLSNYLNQQLYNANAYNTAGNNYFNAATGAYNNNANAFNALNSQGLSGATGLAGQTASGGNTMANTQQGNFGVYQSQPINYGAFSGSPSYTNPYASAGAPSYAPATNDNYGQQVSDGSATAPYDQNTTSSYA